MYTLVTGRPGAPRGPQPGTARRTQKMRAGAPILHAREQISELLYAYRKKKFVIRIPKEKFAREIPLLN